MNELIKERITEALRVLATARNEENSIRETVDSAWEKITKLKSYKFYEELKRCSNNANDIVRDADQITRELAIEIFEEIHEKKVIPGVSVIEKIGLVFDHDVALEWCKENLPGAIKTSINAKLFKDVMLAYDPDQLPDFVEIKKVPAVRIAGDLSEYLLEDNEAEDNIPF